MSDAQPPRPRREALGAELRRLRTMAGLTQRQIQSATGLSQSKVFRIEAGQSVPSWLEVRAWAQAAAAMNPDLAVLELMTEAALTELTPFSERAGGLAALQQDVMALEASAGTQRTWNNGIIPGMLQTAPYAAQVLELVLKGDDVAAAIAIRQRRQQILYEPGRRFEFLITAEALRWHAGPLPVLAAQLAHMASVASLPNVELGVIPDWAAWSTVPPPPFALYEDRADEDPLVVVELETGPVRFHGEADIAVFRRRLELLRQSAVWGDEAIAVVRSVAPRGA